MGGSHRRAFSLGWVLISYVLICGGIVGASIGLIAAEVEQGLVPYLAFGIGGAAGGFFAGRASAHRSIIEPAIAGALVVASIVALLAYTAVGPLIYAFARERAWTAAVSLGGCSFVGGLVGAMVGELSTSGSPSGSGLRWLGMAVLITAGALFATTVVSQVLLAHRALEDPELLARAFKGETVVAQRDFIRAVYLALGSAAPIAGFVTQAAAPSRQLLPATVGVFAAYASLLLGSLHLGGVLDDDAMRGALVIAGGAAVLALVGAALAWLLFGLRKRR